MWLLAPSDAGIDLLDSARLARGHRKDGNNRRTVAERKTTRRSDYGKFYRGREGQWTWVIHRVTGVVIILFLFAHVLDTAVVGWGPEAYNRVVSVYKNPIVMTLELALVGCVLFHAFNGVRIMVTDFWPKTVAHYRTTIWVTWVVFVLAMIPVTWIMGSRIVEAIR